LFLCFTPMVSQAVARSNLAVVVTLHRMAILYLASITMMEHVIILG
jgi:hypothetical protein